MTDTLFDIGPAAAASEPAEKLSADQRRTLRQRQDIANGRHPLTRRAVHSDADRTCGNCYFRRLLTWHNKSYPKCLNEQTAMSHGAATDVRASWPGCHLHSYGDPALSPDAARWVPVHPALQTFGAPLPTTARGA